MKSKALQSFVAVVLTGALLAWFLPGVAFSVYYWGCLAGVALVAAFAVTRGKIPSQLGSRGEFLCDSCKYNDPRYCNRAERPNARRCPDYK